LNLSTTKTLKDHFKDFDKSNGYKGLKFGMQKSSVKNIVTLTNQDILKQYSVVNSEYRNWFYISFEECILGFNKKNQLYEVLLSKDEFSDKEYDQFLDQIIELFGNPTKSKEEFNDSEFTSWEGKNMAILIMRKDHNLLVGFSNISLDDSSLSDKLY